MAGEGEVQRRISRVHLELVRSAYRLSIRVKQHYLLRFSRHFKHDTFRRPEFSDNSGTPGESPGAPALGGILRGGQIVE